MRRAAAMPLSLIALLAGCVGAEGFDRIKVPPAPTVPAPVCGAAAPLDHWAPVSFECLASLPAPGADRATLGISVQINAGVWLAPRVVAASERGMGEDEEAAFEAGEVVSRGREDFGYEATFAELPVGPDQPADLWIVVPGDLCDDDQPWPAEGGVPLMVISDGRTQGFWIAYE